MNTIDTIKKQPNQFTVSPDGKAWISQRKLAILCGVHPSSIQKHIRKMGATFNTNEFNQLDDKSAYLTVAYYSHAGVKQAIQTMIKFGQGGARAYIYSRARVKFSSDCQESPQPEPQPTPRLIESATTLSKLFPQLKKPQVTKILDVLTEKTNHRVRTYETFKRKINPLYEKWLIVDGAKVLIEPKHFEDVENLITKMGMK